MKTFQKTILITACAMIFAGGCVFNRQSNSTPVKQVSDGAKADGDMDISTWEVYRNDELGFEMKLPREWSGRITGGIPHNSYMDERHPFWDPELGRGYWSGDKIHLSMIVKQTTSTLEEFNEKTGMGFGVSPQEAKVNDYSAYRLTRSIDGKESPADSEIGGYQSGEKLLIKNNDVYYYLDFSESSNSLIEAQEKEKKWNKALSTLKFSSLPSTTRKAIDAFDWKTYRDEEFGFEMSVPSEWENAMFVSKNDLSNLLNPPFWFSAFDVKFWRNQHVDIVFAVDRSTLTLDEYIKKLGIGQEKIIAMNGMELYQYSEKEEIPLNQDKGTVLYSTVNRIVLKNKDKYYLFNVLSFSEDEQEMQKFVQEWKAAFSTFKPI